MKSHSGDDLWMFGRKGGIKTDLESVELYQKAEMWASFESRKGFRFSSYVGFFGV